MNNTSKKSWGKLGLSIILLAILINIVYIDYQLFSIKSSESSNVIPQIQKVLKVNKPDIGFKTETVLDEKGSEVEVVDLEYISNQIKEATADLTLQIDSLSSQTKNTDNEKIIIKSESLPSPVIQTTTVKEYYIPLGSGSTKSTEWIDIPGAEAYLAPSNYGVITGVYFEASLRNPTGNGTVHARLKNVTDNYSLFESEVSYVGSSGSLVSSGKIPTPVHTKLYRIQMKSSIGAEVVLDNARLKIFVE